MPSFVYPTIPIQHYDLDKEVIRALPQGRCLAIDPLPGLQPLTREEERHWIMSWYDQELDDKSRQEISRGLCLGNIIDDCWCINDSLAKPKCTRKEVMGFWTVYRGLLKEKRGYRVLLMSPMAQPLLDILTQVAEKSRK